MSVKLKLQPFSAPVQETDAISFVISGLRIEKKYRIIFENATLNRAIPVVVSEKGNSVSGYLYVSGNETVEGKINLVLYPSDSVSVVSVYASIEEQTESNAWRLSDIAAFSFQVKNQSLQNNGDKLSVFPPFVGPEQKANVSIITDPNSDTHVIINNKRFIIKTNFKGEGSLSFRAIDVLSTSSVKVVQKFPVYYAKSKDGFSSIYDSGVFVHFVPESMKALQATNDPSTPECAILDPIPGEGLTIRKLDDFCIEGSVVGPLSIFDSTNEESNFYNSQVGFCSTPKQIYPTSGTDSVCRIFNSTSSVLLDNGTGLVAFSSQETFASDPYTFPTLASRVFVAHIPTSLKYRGNPARDGTIIAPSKFYHSVTPANISAGGTYSILFRVDDGSLFEIQYTTVAASESELIAAFVELINADLNAREFSIKAVDQETFIELKSNTRFTIRTSVINGEGTFTAKLKSNLTLDVLVDPLAMFDEGNTLVFLFPKVGYQYHTIVKRDYNNNVIRINVPSGFNNDVGPNIFENIYCQKFVIIDTDSSLPVTDLSEVNPLPYVFDIFNREVSCVYPVIAARTAATGEQIAYVVCQAPVDGIYQLFFYSFRIGSSLENTQWKQLTQGSENKNPRIKCDNSGNLHLVWESDRLGTTQLFYSVLGPASRAINNQALMSTIDKSFQYPIDSSIVDISTPIAIQDSWTRVLSGDGKASVVANTSVVLDGNPRSDSSMAFFSLSKDEFGRSFPSYFGQLSFQVSFDLKIEGLPSIVLDEKAIADKFAEWKDLFVPAGDHKYKKDDNIYTIDNYAPYFDNLIPICGSFRFPSNVLNMQVGGRTVSGYSHVGPNTYASITDEAILAHTANVQHYLLAVMPEKIRFKAKNTEAFFQYCERLGISSSACDGFVNEIEDVQLTGRFKLVLVLATSDNESGGEAAKKRFAISRLFGDYIDFRTSKNIKIAVNYSKMGSDYLTSVLKRNKDAFANEHRFYGDIIVAVENEAVLGQSFLADFSSQYGKFDIALGMPHGTGFVTNESLPYEGNLYEDLDIRQIFTNIAIGPHSMQINADVANLSRFDRNTYQMVVPEQIRTIVENGSFEDSTFPQKSATYPDSGSVGLTSWNIDSPITYYRIPKNDQTGLNYSISGDSWVSLTGYHDGTNTGTAYKGKIHQEFETQTGKSYFLFFSLSSYPTTDVAGRNLLRSIKVTAGSFDSTFNITSGSPAVQNWVTRSMMFVASSDSTTISFENTSASALYGPNIDQVIVIAEEDLNNEFLSFTTAENLMIDQEEFDLNYNLYATDDFSQIPITLFNDSQNRTADLFIDKIDKVHIAWQSNRSGYWDIYYSGSRDRNAPFRFETQISNSKSNSINPSIAVDGQGKRLISWQDNRYGSYQIFSAVSKITDQMLVDRCKQDQVDEFLYEWNSDIDPYFDAYKLPISQLNCIVEFEFTAPSSKLFHFNLLFYEDKDYQNLYKTISSSSNIDGWRVDDQQISYNGLDAVTDSSYVISYSPSYEDGITDRVLYVIAEFQINSNPVDILRSSNIQIVQPYSGLNLQNTRLEANNLVRAILEFDNAATIPVASQDLAYFNKAPFTGMSFAGSLTSLPGVSVGQRVKSVLLHFDPVGASGNVTATVVFNSPILAIFTSGLAIFQSKPYFGNKGITYLDSTGTGVEAFDTIRVSEDRMSLEIFMIVNPAIDEIRVILEDDTQSLGERQFIYYCPIEQSTRCDINCAYINNHNTDKNVHFRITFYADAEKTNAIKSTFSSLDTLGWKSGVSSFPVDGLVANPSQKISAVYVPEVLPFELYEAQTKTQDGDLLRQSLICGVTYYVTIESYVNEIFTLESQFQFICPCARTESDLWRKDRDSSNWICSGQGFDDFRISETDNQCLFPKVSVTDSDLFLIVWSDFRYTRMLDSQLPISPDYFAAFYDSNTDSFTCSGQGSYDRRLTTYTSENGRILYDASYFIDQFQNINLIAHDGTRVFAQACSFGCKFSSLNSDLILPCMFTDETDSSFFVVGEDPERDTEQYQKIRIAEKYIAFSTYLDLEKPIQVVNDCFIELDIIGIPGTYAYRLKNENDEDWTEWLPIGPDLPIQTQTDKSTTQAERDFFRAYFIQKTRFIAPWVTSAGNGVKRVCCEILTFFGKSKTFCIDFMAIYESLQYKVDLFFDSDFTLPVPKFKNYMVVSEYQTKTLIDDENLTSIKEDTTKITTIYARIEFKDKQKIQLIEKLQTISRFAFSKELTMSVYQQGINDQLDLPLEKIETGIYSGHFSVEADDGVINIDGLAVIVINIPGQCKPMSFEDLSYRIDNILASRSIDQKVSVFNNFTIFRDQYLGDDIKGSFGAPDYYKIRVFGDNISRAGVLDKNTWIGGGSGPLQNATGYVSPAGETANNTGATGGAGGTVDSSGGSSNSNGNNSGGTNNNVGST